MKTKYSYFCVTENQEIEGFANSVFEAKEKIREAIKGKIDWKNDVTILEVKENG